MVRAPLINGLVPYTREALIITVYVGSSLRDLPPWQFVLILFIRTCYCITRYIPWICDYNLTKLDDDPPLPFSSENIMFARIFQGDRVDSQEPTLKI